ncbi:MAG: hypothetical protein ACRD8W_18160 [Nitrososphaeraceae archaeon]
MKKNYVNEPTTTTMTAAAELSFLVEVERNMKQLRRNTKSKLQKQHKLSKYVSNS